MTVSFSGGLGVYTVNIYMKSRIKISPVGIALLKMVAVTGIVITVVVLPGMAMVIAPFLKKKQYSPTLAVKRNIRSLIKGGLVVERKNAQGETILEITKRGKWEAMIRQDHIEQSKKKWNGEWHIVIFDIPSAKGRRVRSELHRAMRLYGFKMLQKSVWVYPHDCDAFLKTLKAYLGVSHDILYIKSHYIENDTHLKRAFNI